MARLNKAAVSPAVTTHEGGPAVAHLAPLQQLKRSVMSCLLWENEFYEDGQEISARIIEFANKVTPEQLAATALEARNTHNLRHAPLLLLEILSKAGSGRKDHLVADTVAGTVQRVDEMPELLAVLWRNGHKMVPAQMRNGLARVFSKFDEYQFAKYDRPDKVKLRDVLRLVRPKPEDEERSALYKRIKLGTLARPDTWESALVGGADKKETFERLLREHKLGYMALLRNLRKMAEVGVNRDLVQEAILARRGGAHRVLPFRYVAAARAAPQYEPALDKALCAAIAEMPVLPGHTFVLVDVSGSMAEKLSGKSDMRRVDAAAALASLIPGDVRVFIFHNECEEIPARRGMAGVDAIVNHLGGGTNLGHAVMYVNGLMKSEDRLIVISDEQTADYVPQPKTERSYMINVASARNGIGYGKPWMHFDGFSEGVLRFILAYENAE